MTVLVHVGETLTGRITDTIPTTGALWADTLNDTGSISNVTVSETVVKALNLRARSHGMRAFLAVERDGRIKQAGPITARGWDWERGQATFGAQGIWAWLDRRVIRPHAVGLPWQKNAVTVSGKSLGGLARALVELASTGHPALEVPIVLPADEAGDHTETFPLWAVMRHGEQLRQITQRATDAPDIRFQPRRRADDPRYIEWVMQVGTAATPTLSQTGPDWVFDASAPQSPVLGISTIEDTTDMAEQVYLTGNGMEEDILFDVATSFDLLDLGWPLTEADESHPTVEDQATLNGHTDNFLARVNRPIESFRVSVRADAAREVVAGDYAQIITKGDAWIGTVNQRMRVKQISGDLSDTVTMEMFPVQAAL